MKRYPLLSLMIIILILSLAACVSPKDNDSIVITSLPTTPPLKEHTGNADVLFVLAERLPEDSWTISVTVSRPDTGWEDYADGWDVVLPDGTVVKPDPESAFTRLLAHPHEKEQPFTRSQSGIIIPNGITSITVRAHELVDGYGGKEVAVHLNQNDGLNFEVINPLSIESSGFHIGMTNLSPDGNRFVDGQINLPALTPIDIPLKGEPVWIVGVPYLNHSIVVVVALQDGRLQGFQVTADGYTEISLPADSLPPGAPPVVMHDSGSLHILNATNYEASPTSSPIFLESGSVAFISQKAEVTIQGNSTTGVNALPDSRLLSDREGQILLLSNPTTAYNHAVLGDEIEAAGFTLLDEQANILGHYLIGGDKVIEGIAPIWTDLNGDGEREIILTLSSQSDGAQLVVFSEQGDLLAQGEAIGTGYRWRHQIAAAPFAANGEIEIVDVLTPHLGGIVEFFSWEGDRLIKTAQLSGYTSHVIGTRNLDMAFAGDVDADGIIELLLPSQSRDALGAIQRTTDGAEVAWEIDLGGILVTNLHAIPMSGETFAVAAGLQSGILKVWMPSADN